MDYQKQINQLEMNINKMMELLGTKFEADYLEKELQKEFNQKKKDSTAEPPKVYSQSFSNIINYMRQQKTELLKNKELAQYFEAVNKNQTMLKNFSNYANTSLNIKDKVRILMHIKEEILELSNKIGKLEEFQSQLETMKEQTQKLENKFSEDKMIRLQKLIERSEKQNEEVSQIIEVYKDMVTYINNKIVAQAV